MRKIITSIFFLVLGATCQASVILKESQIHTGHYVFIDAIESGAVKDQVLAQKGISLALSNINRGEGTLDFQLKDPHHLVSRIVISENGKDFGKVSSEVNESSIQGHLVSDHGLEDHSALKIYFSTFNRSLHPHYIFSWPGDNSRRSQLWIEVDDPASETAEQYRIILNAAEDNNGHTLAYSSPWLPLPPSIDADSPRKKVFPVGVANPPMNATSLRNIDGEVQLNSRYHESIAVTNLVKGTIKNESLKRIGLDVSIQDIDAKNHCVHLSYKDPQHLLLGVELKHPKVKLNRVSHHQESMNNDHRYIFCSNVPVDDDKTFMQIKAVNRSETKRIPFHINKISLNQQTIIG